MSKKQSNARKTKPEGLIHLINQVNLLPSWMELPYFGDLRLEAKHSPLYEALEKLTTEAKQAAGEVQGRKRDLEKDVDKIEERIKRFKHDVLGNFDLKANFDLQAQTPDFKKSEYLKSLYEAVSRYERFYYMRMQLRSFVGLKDDILHQGEGEGFSVYRIVNFLIDSEGRLRLQTDELLDALNGVEYSRLRECPKCRKIFWAARITKLCCGDECRNAYHALRSINKRKSNTEGADWRREVRLRARGRAIRELERMGYTQSDIDLFQKKRRKHPRRIISDWLEKRLEQNKKVNSLNQIGKYLETVRLPREITQPIRDFLLNQHSS